MPKAEKGSAKDIANRMKAKGLQKLKFYCQMCQKQCRDANGFKCHIQSESHLRQMKIFGDNASGYLQQYSNTFEKIFLSTLKMRHGTKKVNANNVYQEVIADKQHVHMNATHWTTLTDFVQYLGKSGKCLVEENHSDGTGGWSISYIERDAGILARREAQERREASDRKAEAAWLERMKVQRIEAAKALEQVTGGSSERAVATSIMDRGTTNHKPGSIKIKGLAASSTSKSAKVARVAAFGDEEDEDEIVDGSTQNGGNGPRPSRRIGKETRKDGFEEEDAHYHRRASRKRKLEDTRDVSIHHNENDDDGRSERQKIRGTSRPSGTPVVDPKPATTATGWLYRDILVRIISKKLEGGKYYRKKAVVDRVVGEGGFVGEVEVLDGDETGAPGDLLRLDQADLETVVPKSSEVAAASSKSSSSSTRVRILNGIYRGRKASVVSLDKSRYRADVVLLGRKRRGREKQWSRGSDRRGSGDNDDEEEGKLLKGVPYENISRVAH